MVHSIQRLSTVLDNHSDRLQSLEKRIDELHSDSLVDHLQFKKSTKQIIDDLTKENDLLKSEFKSISSLYNIVLENNSRLRNKNSRYEKALKMASKYANRDDVNGQAGEIALEALKE